MPNVSRTRTALLALLADNNSGDITPQIVRDALVSIMGGIGGIYAQDAAAAQATTESYQKVIGFTGAFSDDEISSDAVDDKITVLVGGVYTVYCGFSFFDGSNRTYTFSIAVNGTPTAIEMARQLGGSGDVGNSSMFGPIPLSANDEITILVKSDLASNFTLVHAQLIVERRS